MRTVKIILSMFVMLAFIGLNESFGQWSWNAPHIYNSNTGNVGIGTSTPGYLLHVSKNMTSPSIRIHNAGGIGGAAFEMVDNNSGADWKFKATNAGGFKIRDHANGLDVIQVEPNSGANMIYITTNNLFGVGTNTPTDFFDLRGDMTLYTSYPFITLNNTSLSGNAGIAFEYEGAYRGWLYYNDASDQLVINAEAGSGYRPDLVIKSDGRVCMGTLTAATGYNLSVNGKVACTEVLVQALTGWPDYVFDEDYSIMSLQELENSIRQNNHLPGIPSAEEVGEIGFELGDMQIRFVEKLEELTLYTIEQGKQIEALQQKIVQLEEMNCKKKVRKQR